MQFSCHSTDVAITAIPNRSWEGLRAGEGPGLDLAKQDADPDGEPQGEGSGPVKQAIVRSVSFASTL